MSIMHAEADYTDHYLTDTFVPQVSEHQAVRVTRGSVRIEHTSSDPRSREVRVTLRLTGEPVDIRDGRAIPRGGMDVAVFGLGQERTRYELCQAMVRDALERHQIDTTQVVGFAFLQGWDEYTATSNWNAVNLAGSPSKFVVGQEMGNDIEDDRW